MTHSLSACGGRQAPCDVTQRDVGDAGVEHLHERGDRHRDGDDPRIDPGAGPVVKGVGRHTAHGYWPNPIAH